MFDLSSLLNTLLMPFQFLFMQQAFLVVFVLSLPMAILSCYIVLKGWSLMGDAIAHAVLPGVVVAYLLAIPLSVGAFGAGLCCALTTGFIKDNSRLREDTIMGIVFSAMFAIGIILFHKADTDLHLTHLLLGDILGISRESMIETGLIGAFVLIVMIVRGRDLMLLIFDPQQAQITGVSIKFWHYGIQVLLALSIVAALQAVGMILSIALLIAPGACALLVTKRFSSMIKISITVATSSSVIGVYASFFIDSAPAATIVLCMALIFSVLFGHQLYQQKMLIRKKSKLIVQTPTLELFKAGSAK